jgi:LL-diaminopimelate aminotransferase
VQRAAEAIYSPEGQKETKALIDYYMANADVICATMDKLGYDYVGGKNSPYIWVDGRMDSWAFFDMLLERGGVVCTPGAGFGKCGNGYIRISAFNNHDRVEEAMQRLTAVLSGK